MNVGGPDFNYTHWITRIHYPGFSTELATKLITDYTISGVGIDTASIDPGNLSTSFPSHFTLLQSNKWALENLCCLEKVAESGDIMVVLPPKVVKGSGFTVRVIVDTDSSYIHGMNSGAGTVSSAVMGFICLFFAVFSE